VPARLINIKYITIRAEKVASPVTALQPPMFGRATITCSESYLLSGYVMSCHMYPNAWFVLPSRRNHILVLHLLQSCSPLQCNLAYNILLSLASTLMWSYAKFHFSIDLTILKIAKWIIFIEKQCMLICYACTCIYFMNLNIMDFTVWTTERRPDITTCSIA